MRIDQIRNTVICGDCSKVMAGLPKAKMVFADPPDNLGLKYDGYRDKVDTAEYITRLSVEWPSLAMTKADIVWFSIYHRYLPEFLTQLFRHQSERFMKEWSCRVFIWRFTFGQHRESDFGNGYRPIIRIMKNGTECYPSYVREPSKRQTLYNDKRANPAGRVPDDVWDYSRVCGTFNERRKWHPTQHPEALIERIVKFSCKPGDTVIDMFAGTGTVNRVCRRLGVNCYGIENSEFYCQKIQDEAGVAVLGQNVEQGMP